MFSPNFALHSTERFKIMFLKGRKKAVNLIAYVLSWGTFSRGWYRPDKTANESEKEFIEDINCSLHGSWSIKSIAKTFEARYLVVVRRSLGKRKEKKMNRALYWFSSPFSACGILLRARLYESGNGCQYFVLIKHHESAQDRPSEQ